MEEYLAFISCDTAFFTPLGGKYTIMNYTLEPSEVTKRSQHRGVANFTISFPFKGLPERGLTDPKRTENMFRNMEKSVEEAKLFIAWLSVASNSPLDLSHYGFGGSQGFGPSSHEPIDEFDRDLMIKVHHIKKDVEEGIYQKVKRPIYESFINDMKGLRIPHDFPSLTQKLFALSEEHKEMFFDSCLSYQFALNNMGTIPSVSLVAFVNVVESLMRDEVSSGYCERFNVSCPNKRDVMKKISHFF